MKPWISRLWWQRYLTRNSVPFDILDEFQAMTPEQQRLEMARRLQSQVQYFGSREDALPEWREAARIADPLELWRVWPSLPIVTKSTLRSHFEPVEMQRRFQLQGRVDGTGGSTGEPTRFFHDDGMLKALVALDVFTRQKMGWRPGMPTVLLWGSDRDIGKSIPWRVRMHYRVANDIPILAFRIDPSTVERVLGAIGSVREVAIYGFTSLLDYLARAVIDLGVRPAGVRAAWNGGEMLFPDQVERFGRAFGVRLRNRYGGREMGALAAELEDGAPLTVLRPWVFVEVVNACGQPAAPGESGRLLCTSTVCRGTPFLRYEVGDRGSFDAGGITESGIGRLASLEGRNSGLIELADGRQISPLYWNHLLKGYSEVRQFQLVVSPDRSLQVLLEGQAFSEERRAALSATLAGFLGPTPFEIREVGEIPRTAQGKLVQVVRL